MSEEYLRPGHLPPLSDNSYRQERLRYDIQRAKEDLARMNLKKGIPLEAPTNPETKPQEYLIKFNDKSRFILYSGKEVILADIVVQENLPEGVIVDFKKMTEKDGQQINSRYVVTQPTDRKPETGTIYLRMYDPEKDGEYYRAHGIIGPAIPAEDLRFSDTTKADLIQKGLLESK
jgi:hypothetical protein